MKKLVIILIVIVIVLVVAAVVFTREAGEIDPFVSTLLAEPNAVHVFDQKPGNEVMIKLVVMEQNGFVVIHEDASGAPGAIIGATALLAEGAHGDISAALLRSSADGENLYAMLHTDNGDGTFSPADDGPVMGEGGTPIMIRFLISETAETPSDIAL